MNQPLQHEHGPHGAAGHDASPSTPLRTPRGSLGPRLPRRIAAVVLSSALGLGLVHHPVPSRAQTAEARGAAQNKARMGRALADSGKHEAALQYFKDAYEIHQDPGYLYNLGIEYQALGRDVDALAAFDLFLRDAQKIPPEFVADAHQQLRELHKRLGTVEIRCTQEGARILVDDQQRGKTPGDRLVSVVPGTHRVSVLKDGFEPFTTTLAVAPGAKVSVEALLRVVPVATSPIASGFGAAGPRGAGGQAAGSGAGAPPAAPMTSGTFGGAWGTNGEGMPAPDAAASGEQPSSSPWGLPSRTHLTASSGVGVWLGGVPESPGPSAVFSVGAGYAITRLSARTDFRLGGRLGLTFLSEPTSTDVFVSILLNPMVTMAVVPGRLHAFGQLGLGALVLSGVREDSVLLQSTAASVSGALSTFELRPGIGAAYAMHRLVSVFFAPEIVWNPRPSIYFQDVSITRLELTVGALVHL